MTAHTAGPWEVAQTGGRDLAVYGRDRKNPVCVFHMGFDEEADKFPNAKANARLIAAAPDLLIYAQMEEDRMTMPVLAFRRKWHIPDNDEAGALRRVRQAALAKAEGR